MKIAERKSHLVSPVASPSTSRHRKDIVIPIRVSQATLHEVETQLAELGVNTPRGRMDFYRGAIYAAITNARHANIPEWKAFVAAVQPLARKHLGIGITLDGADAAITAGHGL